MILSFSGTGNSRYAATIFQTILGDELVSINELLRAECQDGPTAYAFESQTPYIVVCPTYCWRVPRVVEDFLRRCTLRGSRELYFFLTCGDDTGIAAKKAEALCGEIGMDFMGLSSVKMPENYICMFSAPSYDEALMILRTSRGAIESAARLVSAGRRFAEDPNASSAAKTAINPFFYRHYVNDKAFAATDKCISCGQCAAVCPLGDIELVDGRPRWKGRCTQCQACISVCPRDAIEYGKKTRGKRRYYLFPDGRQKS